MQYKGTKKEKNKSIGKKHKERQSIKYVDKIK